MEFREDPAGRHRAVLDAASGLTKKCANAIAARARQIVPVDTGDLQSTIGVRPGLFGAHEVHVGGDDADYWAHVEYGHRVVTREGVDTGRRQPAQPYMRPAIYAVRGE